MSPTLLDRLRAVLPAERVLTDGPAYTAARTVWNGAVDRRPAAVVRCHDPADVAAAVRAAREAGTPLSVRGGGHGWAGQAVADDGLTLDLTPMRAVTVDPQRATARVAGGATAADVAAAAGPAGLVAATGTVGSVGMVGHTLGGGYGPLSGALGLGVDTVVSVDLVLADGTAVTVDAASHPDLFWALRGGGGNFGVVTAMTVRLARVPALLGGMIVYRLGDLPRVFPAVEDDLLGDRAELTVQTGIVAGPDGSPVMFLAPTWCGAPGDGHAALDRLARLAEPLVARTGPTTQGEVLAANEALFPPGRHVEIRPRTVAHATPALAELLVEHGGAMTSPWSAIAVHSLHAAAARPAATDTAFGLRAPHLLVENVAIWAADDPREEEHRAWLDGVADALTDHAVPGTYANLLGPDDAGLAADAYGPNAERLLRAKRTYDPDGVFAAIPLPSRAGAP